jgi:hypothetical protein
MATDVHSLTLERTKSLHFGAFEDEGEGAVPINGDELEEYPGEKGMI